MGSSAERNMGMLSPQHRLIMEILDEGPMDGGEVFRRFTELSGQRGLPGIVDRTMRNYLDRLIQVGLVRAEGDSRWRKYSLSGQETISSGK
jgi:DNA-binding transcriptional ArsR family regulator